MLASTHSGSLIGISATSVSVEANSGERGDPRVVLVGLPDAAVKESLDRVHSSLSNSGFSLPRTRVTVNLAPADLRKEGSSFDLPVALCLLSSTKQLSSVPLQNYMIAGELGLSGQIRPVRGGISMAMLAKQQSLKGVILPKESAKEASIVQGIDIFGVDSLSEVVDFLEGKVALQPMTHPGGASSPTNRYEYDFSDIKGQHNLRRAVEVAVSGGHNILMLSTYCLIYMQAKSLFCSNLI